MARVVRLQHEDHWVLQSLLPWYVAGRLDREEHARIEAHLAGCLECRQELEGERQLAQVVSGLPAAAERGGRRATGRIRGDTPRRSARARSGLGRLAGSAWARWSAAACVVVIVGLVALPRPPVGGTAADGTAATMALGRMAVIFRPDTAQRDILATLRAVNARIVDGPTADGTYVLAVPVSERAKALVELRAQADVAQAEPSDSARAP